jgi:hypothetical protein
LLRRRILFLVILAVSITACGSASLSEKAQGEFYSNQYQKVADELKEESEKESKDQLLYVLDRATALFLAQNYEESLRVFHKADKLAEIADYTSLTKETATLITNDKIIPYKGEEFEYVLISQYLALNYLMLQKYEDALVECRRVNQKIYQMVFEGKRKYQQSAMAIYLSAMIYEDQKKYDDAYIDYQKVYELKSDLSFLREDLYRLAWLSKNRQGQERWKNTFSLTDEEIKHIKEKQKWNEVIVIAEVGKSPEKRPHPNWSALPKYVSRFSPVRAIEVFRGEEKLGSTEPLFDVEATSVDALDQKFAGLIAKRIGGVVAKEVLADQVERRVDPLVGGLLRLGMYIADQADLRSWLTLPREYQVFRFKLEPTLTQVLTFEINGKKETKEIVFTQKKQFLVLREH